MTAIVCAHCGASIDEFEPMLGIKGEGLETDNLHFDCLAPHFEGRVVTEALARSVADQVNRLYGQGRR